MFSSGKARDGFARSVRPLLFWAFGLPVALTVMAPLGRAQTRDLVISPVEPANRITLAGHHPAWASVQNDLGPVPEDSPIGPFEFVLSRSPQQQQAFEQFIAEQTDPASPNFHHWLTPVEVGERFGVSQHDMDAIVNWMQSQNLHLDSISKSRVRIKFRGPPSAIANAFGSAMHYYLVEGEQRFSIAAEPQIPTALAGLIKTISGLYTINFRPVYRMRAVQVPLRTIAGASENDLEPDFTNGATHFLFPSDFATIYHLPTANFTGAGQTIAVIGRSRVFAQDITNFQARSGLAPQPPIEIIPTNGVDPGPAQTAPPTGGSVSEDQGEATLDVSRASSIAPSATIDLVVSANSGGGIVTAAEFVVDASPAFANIMTVSFSGCEGSSGQAADNFWDSLFGQASAEGISVFVASGDAGAAGCDAFFTAPPASQSLSINSICASSHVTCVGGTEFADSNNPGEYWSNTNGANLESALGYIPEGGWNEPQTSGGQPDVAASGGGASAFIPTPTWQTGTGVPGSQGRYTPDLAFSAAEHDGYFGCFAAGGTSCVVQNGGFQFEAFSGTSAAAPDMAGIAALLNQKYSAAQGELNSNLYKLATSASNNVFHDVTFVSSAVPGCAVTIPSMCNNSTPGPTSQSGGLSGYLVGTGYDEVTGLGSTDVGNLLTNWGTASTTCMVSSNVNPAFVGTSVTFTAGVSSVANGSPTGTMTFFDGATNLGTVAVTAGTAALNTSTLAVGSHSITASYSGDTTFTASTSAVLAQVINVRPTATALVSSANPSLSGQPVTFTATVTSSAGGTPTGTVSFSDGASSLGSLTLGGGTSSFVTSSLAVASHSIVASYSGDANFAGSTSALISQTVSVAEFGPVMGASTVVAGQSVTISLTVLGSGGSLTLSCVGAPAKSTCVFSPNPVTPTPGGTPVQLTVSTSSSSLPRPPSSRAPGPWESLGVSVSMLALLIVASTISMRRRPPCRLAFGICLAVVALASMLTGCGSSSSSTSTTSNPTYTGTTKGTSTFTVMGVSTSTPPTTISTQISVTVQ